MLPVTSPAEPMPVAPAWAPSEQPEDARDHEEREQAHQQFNHQAGGRPRVSITALTAWGTAASHLSRFQDVWAELTPADRAWFAEDLRDLLVDAVLPETA